MRAQVSDDFRETLDHYMDTGFDEEYDEIDWLYEDLKLGDLTELGALHFATMNLMKEGICHLQHTNLAM